jgi:hypothetical protein
MLCIRNSRIRRKDRTGSSSGDREGDREGQENGGVIGKGKRNVRMSVDGLGDSDG